MMFRYLKLIGLVFGMVVLVAFTSACGSDETASPATLSPASGSAPGNSPREAGVSAARQYLKDTGIDGMKGDLTNPLSCAEIADEPTGRFCIHEDFSVYAPGLVILRLSEAKSADDQVWEMRLANRNEVWEVTSVQGFGVEQ